MKPVMILPPKHLETTANDPNQTRTQTRTHPNVISGGNAHAKFIRMVIINYSATPSVPTLPVNSKGRHLAGEAGAGASSLG